MKLIDKHEFTNGALFETYLLEPADTARYNVAECDVIGFRRVNEKDDRMMVLRPDEALIQARMLVDAVRQVTGEYGIELASDDIGRPLATDLVKDLDEVNMKSRITIDGPPYFEDSKPCGYCGRAPNKTHEVWCRQ